MNENVEFKSLPQFVHQGASVEALGIFNNTSDVYVELEQGISTLSDVNPDLFRVVKNRPGTFVRRIYDVQQHHYGPEYQTFRFEEEEKLSDN